MDETRLQRLEYEWKHCKTAGTEYKLKCFKAELETLPETPYKTELRKRINRMLEGIER